METAVPPPLQRQGIHIPMDDWAILGTDPSHVTHILTPEPARSQGELGQECSDSGQTFWGPHWTLLRTLFRLSERWLTEIQAWLAHFYLEAHERVHWCQQQGSHSNSARATT